MRWVEKDVVRQIETLEVQRGRLRRSETDMDTVRQIETLEIQ